MLVGRIVFFVMPLDCTAAGELRPAIVTKQFEQDGVVNLRVIYDVHDHFQLTSHEQTRVRYCDAARPEPGRWFFPSRD